MHELAPNRTTFTRVHNIPRGMFQQKLFLEGNGILYVRYGISAALRTVPYTAQTSKLVDRTISVVCCIVIRIPCLI